MKIEMYTHETVTSEKVTGQTIVLLDKEAGRALVEMLRAAADANKRKRSWEKMAKEFESKLSCY